MLGSGFQPRALFLRLFNEGFQRLERGFHGFAVVAFDVGAKRLKSRNQGALQRDLRAAFKRFEKPRFRHAPQNSEASFDGLKCEALGLAQHHVLHVKQPAESQGQDRFDHDIFCDFAGDRCAFAGRNEANALQAFVPA